MASNSIIRGSNNFVKGDNNSVHGDFNSVSGNSVSLFNSFNTSVSGDSISLFNVSNADVTGSNISAFNMTGGTLSGSNTTYVQNFNVGGEFMSGGTPLSQVITTVLSANTVTDFTPYGGLTTSDLRLTGKLYASSVAGVTTLVAGTATVSSDQVTDISIILLTGQDNHVTGSLYIDNRNPGVDFTIKSNNGSDNGRVGWFMVEPF